MSMIFFRLCVGPMTAMPTANIQVSHRLDIRKRQDMFTECSRSKRSSAEYSRQILKLSPSLTTQFCPIVAQQLMRMLASTNSIILTSMLGFN